MTAKSTTKITKISTPRELPAIWYLDLRTYYDMYYNIYCTDWNVRHRRVKKHSADPKEWGPVGFDKSNHLLSVMASSNNIDGVN